MAPFTLKGPGAHGTAGIRIVVLPANATALLIKLGCRLRVRVAGCRAAAGGHRGVGAAGVAGLARTGIPILVSGLVEGDGPRGVIICNGLPMAPLAIERPAGVRIVVLAQRGGSPLIVRFRD